MNNSASQNDIETKEYPDTSSNPALITFKPTDQVEDNKSITPMYGSSELPKFFYFTNLNIRVS